MKVSRTQVAENRSAVLAAAARLFRQHGFDAVSVAEIMKAAGLTHGGFYGHFRSKDDLAASACSSAAAADPDAPTCGLAAYAAGYLQPSHRDQPGQGCVFAALGAEAARQSPAVRRAMTEGLAAKLEQLTEAAPGTTHIERRRSAVSGFAGMVGALVLARMVDDPFLSEEVLAQTRATFGPAEP